MSLLLILLMATVVIIKASKEEKELLHQLLKDYDSDVRPVSNSNETLQVELSFSLLRLMTVNTKEEILSVYCYIETQWHDGYLEWNSSDYKGILQMILPATKIWIPELFILSNVAQTLPQKEWLERYKTVVYNDGTVHWSPGGIVKVWCVMNVKYFPLDHQYCKIDFANWAYAGNMVNLTVSSKNPENYTLKYYEKNNEWDLPSVSIERMEFISWKNVFYPEVHILLHLNRRPLFFAINIVIPSFCLASLVLLMFFLPPESGEKIAMGVTVLVSFSVMSLVINEHIPQSSRNIPLILVFMYGLMSMATLGISETVIILYCFYHNGRSRVPLCLRQLMNINACYCPKGKVNIETENADKNSQVPETKQGNSTGNNDDEIAERVKQEWRLLGKKINQICFCLLFLMFLGLIITLIVICTH